MFHSMALTKLRLEVEEYKTNRPMKGKRQDVGTSLQDNTFDARFTPFLTTAFLHAMIVPKNPSQMSVIPSSSSPPPGATLLSLQTESQGFFFR